MRHDLRQLLVANVAKLALIAAATIVPYRWYLHRLDEVGGALMAAYLVMFGAGFLAILAAALHRHPAIRLTYAVMIAGSAAFVETYHELMHAPLSYDAFVSMIQASESLGDMLRQYLPFLVEPVCVAALLFLGIVMRPRGALPERRFGPALTAMYPLATVAVLVALLYARGGAGATGLPGGILALPYGGLFAVEIASEDVGPRRPVDLPMAGAEPAYDIVLVIDESVRGDFLDVVDRDGVATHLAGRPHVYSFGLAASATNCSAGSNLILRFGGTRDNYRHHISVMPSIWAYAHRAGMHTVYIDGQRTGGRLQNGMDEAERLEIDEFVQLDDVAVVDRDINIAGLLADRTRNGVPELILVNKVGAHFPVHDKYPDAYTVYRPALPRGNYTSVVDTGSREGFGSWKRYVNAYRNTLLWNVGHFFTMFLRAADLDNAIVIYTSDHGQSFGDDGSDRPNLHCSADPMPQEGHVTNIVITSHPRWESPLAEGSRINLNGTSHYNLFPTALTLMGYEPEAVREIYGDSLMEPTRDDMTFNARFNARLGQPAVWRAVDVPSDLPPRLPRVSAAEVAKAPIR